MSELTPIVVASQTAGSDWLHGAQRARRLAAVSLARNGAQQLVALSFFLLAPYIAVEGTHALLVEHHADRTVLGIGLSIATLCICPSLGRAKLRLGEQLASPATAGEGRCAAGATGTLNNPGGIRVVR